MRDALVQVYLHFVWGTWDRLPLITPPNEMIIYKAINEKCKQLGCVILAIGGMADHVHLLVRFPATISVAELIKEVKGSSSHLMTHEINPGEFYKWQGSYAALSISEHEVPRVKAYIQFQKKHHTDDTMDASLEL